MKHILGTVRPHPDIGSAAILKAELAYLRLIYTVAEIRKQGEDAQGYFVVVDDRGLNRVREFEGKYHGNVYVQIMGVVPDDYLRHKASAKNSEILSGIVKAAMLDENGTVLDDSIRRATSQFILVETILCVEPRVQQVKDASRFPFHVDWDYYGVVS